MSGKIILNLAISLDGFIADLDGGFAWIGGQDDKSLDTNEQHEFCDFLDCMDIVVMGKRSFEQGFHTEGGYTEKVIYVITHEKRSDEARIHFISGDVVGIILNEKEAGKNIFLFGGGISIDPFIKADVIDEYRVSIIPVILGKGRPLFLGDSDTISLHLDSYWVNDGVVSMSYIKRNT